MSDDMQAVIDTAQDAAIPKDMDAGALAVVTVRDEAHLETVDLEAFLPAPRRKRGRVQLHTGESLARYVNGHAEAGRTALYGDVDSLSVVAVLNGHDDSDSTAAGWGDHRATLTLRLTPEWKAWADKDGDGFSQTEFAEFLEDHLADIATPPGADLLELAKTFEAKQGVSFKGAIRLDSGQRQLTYQETIEARAGTEGTIVVPETFTLGLAPFEGSDAYKLDARFRYRLNSGSLKLSFVLNRPDLVLRAAFDDVLSKLQDDTEVAPLRGLPPS